MVWTQRDFEAQGFSFADAENQTTVRFLDYWNHTAAIAPGRFVDHIKCRQDLDVNLYIGVTATENTSHIPDGGVKLSVLAMPEGSFVNYSSRHFYLSAGVVACEHTVNNNLTEPRFDMPKLEAGTILAAADMGADRLTRFAWGALGSAIWPRSYGYTPTLEAWQDTGTNNMRTAILNRVAALAENYSGGEQLQQDYRAARQVLLDPDASPWDFVDLVRRSTPVPVASLHEVGHSQKSKAIRGDNEGSVPFGIAIAADLPTGFDVELHMGNLGQITHVFRKVGWGMDAARQVMILGDAAQARRQSWRDPGQDIGNNPPPSRPRL